MERAKLLHDAEQIICQDRNTQYGEPEDNFKLIAEFWSAYLGTPIDAKDVAQLMILFKIARTVTGQYKRDNYVDMIGYAACAGEIAKPLF